eukprot:TRINITY_DN12333_c0_g1_i1.p1 TRINITY_DN12333_c0_g1~~TRINITY_DN12333_c0_g1_i1.p1  ORF type:complete len:118 (-),score=28.15 TRINITY_DN12333_c0_g1_i1:79-432(-)
MLKPKVLPKILEQANTNGIKNTLLFNFEGSLLASAGEDSRGSQVVAAIVANIWKAYEKGGELDTLIFECEQGRVLVLQVSKLLLCLYGDTTVELGMLRAKANVLKGYLKGPLDQVVF